MSTTFGTLVRIQRTVAIQQIHQTCRSTAQTIEDGISEQKASVLTRATSPVTCAIRGPHQVREMLRSAFRTSLGFFNPFIFQQPSDSITVTHATALFHSTMQGSPSFRRTWFSRSVIPCVSFHGLRCIFAIYFVTLAGLVLLTKNFVLRTPSCQDSDLLLEFSDFLRTRFFTRPPAYA